MSAHARPALDILAELRRGRLSQELTDEIAKVIAACQDTGKPGEVVVKLKFTPKKVNDHETPRLEVTDQVGSKVPRRSVLPSTFFLTDDGRPVRRDPNQDEFPSLQGVPTDPADATASTAARREA
ncbi:hypothetical protein [Nocardioides lianchengensis]|uniref:Uncharacterized protein n=1 Tax=Nocardioides lianchengensis TaxID=1045774 RepID=A0A1G6LQ67_9ACTN|nr:hypothetical protein [Nocardioides lianchengensis]NYG12482.1 hypothetical protein [Nocardioides lianchengensis]SDC45264.1 hypothetical protein SAMN05421872_102323 [Nocardioides lianchengensis]